ncbi:hypothetical protein [Pelagicoccus sp. SDUM812003]|uniref:hypothetical protein n=1 Tax=Pelagicoccus sp. SDUM812003 TaxID=3041267 RepID=UPI00280D1DAF|nr:hypothetical protein [Pelagicoccus sp. SDUM812003]MDQ8202553.1 hypothetical protein [Pelagicoccus sp. SDUM812003]
MDSYLSGRERVGDSPKSREDPKQLGQKPLGELVLPEAADAELKEDCGEGGSRVAYVTENGRVTKIVVTCNCGQVTEIDCRYED